MISTGLWFIHEWFPIIHIRINRDPPVSSLSLFPTLLEQVQNLKTNAHAHVLAIETNAWRVRLPHTSPHMQPLYTKVKVPSTQDK